MPPLESSRSTPSDSTLSCITVVQEVGVSSDGIESTPPTSVTDSGSILSGKDGMASAPGSRRVSRNGTGVTSYNENVLSRATRPTPRSPAKGKTVLGKRGRESSGKGANKKRRVSRRLIQVEKQKQQAPESPKKQTRQAVAEVADTAADAIKVQPPKKPRVTARSKKYLAQGLYVGQDPSFDPRWTEEKNKKKLAAKGTPVVLPQRTILPELMFAGKRLVDQGRGFRLPFNICSPLPPGQSRPDEWRKTQKNVFVGDAADFWRITKRTEQSTCICDEESGCDEHCLNRYMFYECDSNNCNLGPTRCTNRAFEDLRRRVKAGGKFNVGVDVIKTVDRGYGVRSNRCFEPNQIIMEYTGEIITQEECDMRMHNRYKDNECFYLMMFDQNMIIDATRGSIARFVNHSCAPNCRMEKWTVAGKPRMALFAGEDGIVTGEELSYDYNFDPFSSKNMTECRCGSEQCRGVLGPRNKDKDVKEGAGSGAAAGSKGASTKVAGTKRKRASETTSPIKKRKSQTITVVVSETSKKGRKMVQSVSSKASPKKKRGTTATKATAVAVKKRGVPVKKAITVIKKRAAPIKRTLPSKKASTTAAKVKAARTTKEKVETKLHASVTLPTSTSQAKVGKGGRKSQGQGESSGVRMEPIVVLEVAAKTSAGAVKARAETDGIIELKKTTKQSAHGSVKVETIKAKAKAGELVPVKVKKIGGRQTTLTFEKIGVLDGKP